jgi:hypothetical protein
MIQVSGMVPTEAGTFSEQPMQLTVKQLRIYSQLSNVCPPVVLVIVESM